MKKVLIIAGASGNLGKGLTEVLVRKDYEMVYLLDRNPEELFINERVIQIKVSDLASENNVRDAFSRIKTDMEAYYFLFTTIGGYLGGKLVWETTLEEFDKMLKINLYTSFLIAKYFSILVSKSAGGSVCFTSSMTSSMPESGKSAYGTSKSALNYFVKTLALEGRQINMSVNAVAPWILNTEENRVWVKNPDSLIKSEEIGELVHDLFSSYNFVSGNIIDFPVRLQKKLSNY